MGKFYWLKIKKDFYKRHDIKIIESMPNGVEYIWFYLKLMMESVDHEGLLRFNEYIPYDDNMLSVITGTNIDIVRSAMKVFAHMNMIELMDDKTIYIETVAKMIGSETSSAERVRKHREKVVEIETDTLIDVPEEKIIQIKDTKHRYGQFKHVMLSDAELSRLRDDYKEVDIDALIEYFDSYIEEKGYKSKNHNLAIRRWVVEAFTKPKQNQKGRVEMPMNYNQESTNMTEEDIDSLKEALRRIS